MRKQISLQNHCDIPVVQLFEPANIPALYDDHDYLRLHAEDQFLEDSGLLNIIEGDRETLQLETREQGKCEKWKFERTKRVTASNFGEICRATDRRDRKALASRIISKPEISTEAIRWGIRQESSAVKMFEQVNFWNDFYLLLIYVT